jgi:hypothetical protein
MHSIEPYWNWREFYTAENDPGSPFYGREYSEFEFQDAIYDHVIHPQWDNFESQTLFLKILFADYDSQYAIIEFIGEWNDTLYNDVMYLKRNIIDPLVDRGITKFILIGENILNFHSSDDCYYEEWFDDIEEGWIALLNFREHVLHEFKEINIDHYFLMDGAQNDQSWRTNEPEQLYSKIEDLVQRRIG